MEFFVAHDLGVPSCDMDESGLTVSTIDVSCLPNSSEYSLGRCKHTSEEWVSLKEKLKAFTLKNVHINIVMMAEMLVAIYSNTRLTGIEAASDFRNYSYEV